MKKQHTQKHIFKLGTICIATVFFLALQIVQVSAKCATPPPEKIEAIMLGDRVVDIAWHLGVLPRAMSVRASLWEKAGALKIGSQILGCPMFTTVKKRTVIPDALKQFGIKRVIVEKNPQFCLYKKSVQPNNIAQILKGSDAKIEYVDFSKGIDAAVKQVAKLVGKENKADAVLKKYHSELKNAQKIMPKKLGKKVLILNGTYQKETGKTIIRVEAPGLYSDQFLLKPMGCSNVGNAFKPADGKMEKGYYIAPKKKGKIVLDALLKANPDIIVITGNSYAVQKNIASCLKTNPALGNVKAIKKMAIYHLPLYVDSGILEYPHILLQWAVALRD